MRSSSLALGVAVSLLAILAVISFVERDTISEIVADYFGRPEPAPNKLEDKVASDESSNIRGQIVFEREPSVSSNSTRNNRATPMDKAIGEVKKNIATAADKLDQFNGQVGDYKEQVLTRYRGLSFRTRVALISVTVILVLLIIAVSVILSTSRLIEEHRVAEELEANKPLSERMNDFFEPSSEKSWWQRLQDVMWSAGFLVKLLLAFVVILMIAAALIYRFDVVKKFYTDDYLVVKADVASLIPESAVVKAGEVGEHVKDSLTACWSKLKPAGGGGTGVGGA